jgi:uncharacterized phage protein gp47/JayE
MGQFQPKTYEAILIRMINRVVARTDLTDINDGSDLKQVLAAAAREDDAQYFQMIALLDLFDIMKARGTDLDERAKEYNPNIISRRGARRATGQVVFSRTGTTGAITIPIGTQVQVPAAVGNPAIVFTTTEEGTIPNGSTDSGLVDVVAALAGESGNADVDTVTGFATKPAGVDTVTNPAAFTNGRDEEKDDSFRQRLLAYVKGLARSHVAGLEAAVLGLTDDATGKTVQFVSVVEDIVDRGNVIVYIDDGAGSLGTEYATVATETLIASALGGEVDFWTVNKPIKTDLTFTLKKNGAPLTPVTDYTLNPASGQIKLVVPLAATNSLVVEPYSHYTGLIQEAQKIIDGDPSDRANYPGYRAAGVLVRVLSPQIVQLTIQANITVRQGYSQTALASQVANAISGYVNALGISEDVIVAELTERAMAVPGMFDIRFVVPTENRVILDDQIARLLSSNISIT